MADPIVKVWAAYAGEKPTPTDTPLAQIPLSTCIDKMGLRASHRMSLPEEERPRFPTPRGGKPELDLVRGPLHVVVEVTEDAASAEWPKGFYRLPMSPEDAGKKLAS